MDKKTSSRVFTMNQYRLIYDQYDKKYFIENANGTKASINYLSDNYDNYMSQQNFILQYDNELIGMLRWLKKNCPELLI